MNLNDECIKDILISVEEAISDPGKTFSYIEKYPFPHRLNVYEPDVVLYHLRQCDFEGFFKDYRVSVLGEVTIEDLSPEGHRFLDTIREDTIWERTKEVFNSSNILSISALKFTVAKVAEQFLNGLF